MTRRTKRGGRFWTHFSIWGETLDVDRLVAMGQPRGKHEMWRRGDATLLGTKATTAGLTMTVYDGDSRAALCRALKRFLTRQSHFLRVARERTPAGNHSGFTTFISVGSDELIPVGVELPADILQLLGMAGLSWTVTASVFETTHREKRRSRPTRR